MGNVYARSLPPSPHSVSPGSSLLELEHPYRVAGDFNIHNAASDPSRLLSSKEERESAPYFDRASDLGFTLLNIPGVYTRFHFTGTHRPSTMDLAFANPHMFLPFRSWDASSRPSTGSDHAPILISIHPPSRTTISSDHAGKRPTGLASRTNSRPGLSLPPPTLPPPTSSTNGSPRPSPPSQQQSKPSHPAHAPPRGPNFGGPHS